LALKIIQLGIFSTIITENGRGRNGTDRNGSAGYARGETLG